MAIDFTSSKYKLVIKVGRTLFWINDKIVQKLYVLNYRRVTGMKIKYISDYCRFSANPIVSNLIILKNATKRFIELKIRYFVYDTKLTAYVQFPTVGRIDFCRRRLLVGFVVYVGVFRLTAFCTTPYCFLRVTYDRCERQHTCRYITVWICL